MGTLRSKPSRRRARRRSRLTLLVVAATALIAALTGTVPAGAATTAGTPGSAAELDRAIATLDRSAKVPGTAWWIDPASGQVVLAVDSTVTGARLTQVRSVAAGLGGTVRVQTDPGVLSPRISGGQLIHGAGGRCTLGFNMRSGGTYYLLTAGHCVNTSPTWYTDPGLTTVIGPRVASSFPGNDYGIVRYANAAVSHPGSVHLPADDMGIDGSKVPPRFWPIIVSGGVSGVHYGTVTALNVTVNYANGSVSGLIRTDTCSEPGDSGSPLFSDRTAHGVLSGGTGNCATGGVSYFQPVDEAITAYGLSFF